MSALGDILNFGIGTAGLITQGVYNKQARSDQQYFYHMSLPAQQMALRRAAGLNPYGIDGQPATQVPTPVNQAAGMDSSFQQMSDSLNHALDRRMLKQQQNIDRLRLQLEAKRLNNEIDVADYQKKLLGSQKNFVDQQAMSYWLENYIKDKTKENNVQLSDVQLQEAYENLNLLMQQATYNPQQLLENYNKTLEEIKQIKEQIKVLGSQKALNEQKTYESSALTKKYGLESRQSVERFEYELTQLKWDKADIQAIEDVLTKLDSDESLSPTQRMIFKTIFRFTLNFLNADND